MRRSDALGAALAAEARKAVASRVMGATTAILVVGVVVLAGSFELALRAGSEQVARQLGPVADLDGWARLLAVVSQVSAAAALLAFGVGLSWLVGREFADGTITGLFGLAVPRPTIVLGKLLVYGAWVLLAAAALVGLLVVAGLVLGLGPPGPSGAALLGRAFVLVVLTGSVAVPAAWAATLGRGLLPGIAATVGLVVVAQVMAVAGVGGWFPVAAPALWAIAPASVSPLQLALVATVPLAFGALTLGSWARLQLDR